MNINELYFKSKRDGKYIVSAKYDTDSFAIAINVTSDSSNAYKSYLSQTPMVGENLSTIADRWLDNLPVTTLEGNNIDIGTALDSKQKWLLKSNIVKDYNAIVTPVGEII